MTKTSKDLLIDLLDLFLSAHYTYDRETLIKDLRDEIKDTF